MARLVALGPSWGSIETAEGLFRRLVGSPTDRAAFDRGELFDVHMELGFAHQRYGRLADAVPYVRTACEIVDPTDWPRYTLGLFALGALLTSTGDLDTAIASLRAALTSLGTGMAEGWGRDEQLIHWRDPRRTRCLALAELARALDVTGRTDEAESLAEAAREEEIRFGILGGRAHRAIAQVELRRGRPESALQVLAATSDEATPGSLSMRRAADLVVVSAAHLACGEVALALETALEGVSICLRSGAGESLAGLHIAVARAQLVSGQFDDARETLAAAHRAIDGFGTEVYRRDARLVEREIRTGLDPSGTDDGDRGRKAAPMADAGRGRAVPATSPMVGYVRGRALTVREHEILRLMAAGETNRQIALRLGVSDKTVKRHVSNIFNKIVASTRAMAVRRGFESGIL
jgi:DNA-binding CsgD family transcriptional regulator/tetratricopeptide (TPR) repeat protein